MRSPLKRYFRRRAAKRIRRVHPDDAWGTMWDDNDYDEAFWAIATGIDPLAGLS